MEENIIYVEVEENSHATLTFPKYNIKAKAYIGENGASTERKEGNKMTPIGTFDLGIAMGTHREEEMKPKMKIKYMQINENMYWVDDINSKYYNQLVDIKKCEKDWNSAEHLIEFPLDYEYLVDIKVNPENIPDKGSAIFLHCNYGEPTLGCVGVSKEIMEKLIQVIDKDTKMIIKNK